MSGFDVKVENVVVFATLGIDVPLEKISLELEAAEYAPESFPGVIYRIKEPRVATLIFSSGKIVCTGARSPEFARTAVDKEGARLVPGPLANARTDAPRQLWLLLSVCPLEFSF